MDTWLQLSKDCYLFVATRNKIHPLFCFSYPGHPTILAILVIFAS